MKTALLNSLYEKYNIANLSFGAIHDKLGDVYEEYCVTILKSKQLLKELQRGNNTSLEVQVLSQLLDCNNINRLETVDYIEATPEIPHRNTGGNSKTDIIAKVHMKNNNIVTFPISCKQSTVPKVALAEFDVDTICRENGIFNSRLKELLLKHQTDASAKNFSASEKIELAKLIAPISRNFVRWVLTGSPYISINDLCIPTSIIKFKLKKPTNKDNIDISKGDFECMSFEAMSMEKCIDNIMYKNDGTLKLGGFGTGLSWTYATGSKGYKIQFKG